MNIRAIHNIQSDDNVSVSDILPVAATYLLVVVAMACAVSSPR